VWRVRYMFGSGAVLWVGPSAATVAATPDPTRERCTARGRQCHRAEESTRLMEEFAASFYNLFKLLSLHRTQSWWRRRSPSQGCRRSACRRAGCRCC
jgi:hypothetical protein